MTEKRMPITSTGSSVGAQQPHTDIDKAIQSLDQEGMATQQRATKLIELGQAHETMKQNVVRAAAIVTGQVQANESGEVVLTENGNGNSKSVSVQSVTGSIAILLNLAWITYFGTDMPMEVYGAVIVLIMAAGQALATYVNNRKP